LGGEDEEDDWGGGRMWGGRGGFLSQFEQKWGAQGIMAAGENSMDGTAGGKAKKQRQRRVAGKLVSWSDWMPLCVCVYRRPLILIACHE
jgi:hypothetical protein